MGTIEGHEGCDICIKEKIRLPRRQFNSLAEVGMEHGTISMTERSLFHNQLQYRMMRELPVLAYISRAKAIQRHHGTIVIRAFVGEI